jgi:hypothetical protein
LLRTIPTVHYSSAVCEKDFAMCTLPPLYKYLDFKGALLTLANKTFKHAKPSDFNDTEDLTLQSLFPE